jgi:hypothetical protein
LAKEDLIDWDAEYVHRWRDLVKIMCPACDHIQYAKPSSFPEDDDIGIGPTVDGEESADDIGNDWWPGYLGEEDAD